MSLFTLLEEISAVAPSALTLESSDSANSATGTITVTAPTGIQDDDLLLLIVSSDHSGSGDTVYTAPAGFSALTTYTRVNSGAAGVSGQVFYKIASSESGNYSTTETASILTAASIARISGANTSTPFDVNDEDTNTGADPAEAPSVTTTVADTLVIRAAIWDQSKTLVLAPVGVTESTHEDTSGHDQWVGDERQIAAGSTGIALFDLSSSTRWLTYTIAIKA